MAKFENILLCSDIDGTLNDDSHTVSKENLEAIEYFTQNGGTFTIATGRSPFTIPKELGKFIKVPIICQNGSAIFDIHTKKYIDYKELDTKAREIAKDIANKFPNSGIEIFRLYDIAFIKNNNATLRHIETESVSCATHINCTLDEVEGPIIKILFAQEEEETDKIAEFYENSEFKNEYNLVKSYIWYYEILRKDISKGNALKELCKANNFELKNVITVGDNDNDIEMIEVSGVGYAVENATYNLKKVADKITVDNNHHAIAKIISEI